MYEVLSKNKIVARGSINGDIEIIDNSRIPYLLSRTRSLRVWLENRSIDMHRPSSRVLKKILRLNNATEVDIVLKNRALTLTDTYWVREESENIKWEDVQITNDILSSVILNDNRHSVWDFKGLSYELTNTGSYEKCWRKLVDEWYLLKKGSSVDLYSELVAYELLNQIGYPTAEYGLYNSQFVLSKNFTNNFKYCLEDMYSFVDEEEDVNLIVKTLDRLDKDGKKKLIEDYVKILTADILVCNVDRHNHNFGVLRDSETGKIVSLAPNYDNNMCLLSSRVSINKSTPQLFIQDLEECLKESNLELKLPMLDESMIFNICGGVALNCYRHGLTIDIMTVTNCAKFIYRNYLELKELER